MLPWKHSCGLSCNTFFHSKPYHFKSAAKKNLNLGKSGLSAGLDDYVYDGVGQDDEYDFM